jgi:hypothetical protein
MRAEYSPSRRIKQATCRHVSVRFTADSHRDHDTIASFRRRNACAFTAAFEEVLTLASQTGLLKVGMVSVDGTKIDANASKIKSIRYDRIQTLRAKLAEDITALMAKAEAADTAGEDDGLSLPGEIARRETLKRKLDAAARRLEEAAAEHDNDDPPPSPPGGKQTNLTDPDSAIMRKSARHEYRQAYNAQAAVDADGSMLVLATDVLSTTNDRAGLDTLLDQMEAGSGLPETLLADAGYAGEDIIKALEKRNIDPLIAIARQEATSPTTSDRHPRETNRPKPLPHNGD